MGDICQSSYQPAHRRTCGPCIRTRWRPLRTHCTHHKPNPRHPLQAGSPGHMWLGQPPSSLQARRVRMQCACPLALSHQSASTPASSLIPNSRAASGQLWALTHFSYICLDVTSVVQLHKASLRRSLPSILYTPLIPDVKVAISCRRFSSGSETGPHAHAPARGTYRANHPASAWARPSAASDGRHAALCPATKVCPGCCCLAVYVLGNAHQQHPCCVREDAIEAAALSFLQSVIVSGIGLLPERNRISCNCV